MRVASLFFTSLFFTSLLVLVGCGSSSDDASSSGDTGASGDTGVALDSTVTTDSGTNGETANDTSKEAASETTGDASFDAGPIDPTCHAMSVAECAAWHTCVPKGFHDSFADDESLCASVLDAADCEGRIDLPRTGDLATARKACTDALGGSDACLTFLRQRESGACYIRGTGGPGDSCQDGTQCASDSCERAFSPPAPEPVCGGCGIVSIVGGACGFGVTCPVGAGCVSSGSSATCVAFVDEGASCATAPCHLDDRCSGGTCVPRLDVGASCSANGDCLFGEFCSTTDHNCHAGVAVAKAGETCGIFSGLGVIYCSPPLRCLDSGGIGKCGDALKAGDACTVVSDNPCQGTLRCEAGKCAPQDTCAGDAGP